MDIEIGEMKAFPHGPAGDQERGTIEACEPCEACETRPATGVTGLCTWCGPQVAGVVGEMQA